MFLACCHTIIIDHKKGSYNSSSPDELALVNAAKQFGFEFKDRDANDNMVIYEKKTSTAHSFKLLNVCEFTSDRKRMSCIFRDSQGKIILMCKGADTVITERLSPESRQGEVFKKTVRYVDDFAEEGLRTLYLAERSISEQEYNEWNQKFKTAKLQIQNREQEIAKVQELIETNLTIIGSTAIEDRLQEDVPDTI